MGIQRLLLVLGLILAFAGGTLAARAQDAPLGLRVKFTETRMTPDQLTHALSYIGSHLDGGYVLFGVEVVLKAGKEPVVSVSAEPGTDLGTILRQILAIFRIMICKLFSAGLSNIFPRGATDDQKR